LVREAIIINGSEYSILLLLCIHHIH